MIYSKVNNKGSCLRNIQFIIVLAQVLLISAVLSAAPSGLDKNGHLQALETAETDGFSYTTLKNGLQLCIGGVTKNVIFYSPSTVRVTAHRGQSYWEHPSLVVLEKPAAVRFTVKPSDDNLTLVTDRLQARIDKKTGAVTFMDAAGTVLTREHAENPVDIKQVEISGAPTYEVTQRFTLKDRESLYGLGQYTDTFWDYRGQEVYMAQSNIGICIPFLISTERYGIMWDIYSKSIFKDGPEGMSLFAESAPGGIDYYFMAGETMDDVIVGYRELTGAAPMFSKKSFGLWMSKERYATQDRVIEVVKDFRKNGFPLDNIVQDWQYWGGGAWGGEWDGNWSGMIWTPDRYPDPAGMAKTLHEDLNVQLMCSIWPSVGNDTELAKELDQYGLRHEPLHWITGKARIYDAYSEKGREIYFKHTKKGLLDIGVDALWMDGTEVEVGNACHGEKNTEEQIKRLGRNAMGDYTRYLNTYSLMTTQAAYEGQRAAGNKRIFTLTRSAFTGQQRYAALSWSGDTEASYKIMVEQIAGGLNVCMAGQPYWTQDIGGFFIVDYPGGHHNPSFRELYARWNQFGIFNPIYRIHGTNIEREPYIFKDMDPEMYDSMLDAAHLRYRLIPYIYGLAWQSTANGYTMMRGMAMDYPDDKNVRKLNTQFMFGPALLVRVVDRPIFRIPEEAPETVVPGELLQTPDGQNGVAVEYFRGTNFNEFASKAIEPVIDQVWPGPPLIALPEGLKSVYDFSARYEAFLTIPETGEYEIGTVADDGVRFWVDDVQVVNDWRSHAMEYHGGKLSFTKGQKVRLKIEYYQGGGDRGLKLVWKTPDELAQETDTIVDDKVETYLPKGTWYDFWTNEKIEGEKKVKRSCPLDIFPLYVRAGSIVPMSPVMQYVDEKPGAPYEIRVYPGADAAFVIYEDDNETYNYEKGEYVEIPMTWNDKKQTLTIGKRKGKFPGMTKGRVFKIVLISPETGMAIKPAQSVNKEVFYTGKSVKVRL